MPNETLLCVSAIASLTISASTYAGDVTKSPSCVIAIDEGYTVHRTDIENDLSTSPAWVVVKDGEEVLIRDARDEKQFQYFRQNPGVYTIYVQQFVNGIYRVISNVVSYQIPETKTGPQFKSRVENSLEDYLWVGHNRIVNRPLVRNEQTAQLTWVVQKDGQQVLAASAKNKTQFRYFGRKAEQYKIFVREGLGGKSRVVGNVVEYTIE